MDPVSKVPRKRTANYTAEEKSLLIQLMKKRPFLKSKLTDGKSIARKKMEWEIVTREFNRHSHIYKRDTLALKRAWENMSRRSRAPRRNLPRTDIGDSNTAPTPDIGTKVEE
ncbi:jg4826, partial [Pararge aegeria aegeria]